MKHSGVVYEEVIFRGGFVMFHVKHGCVDKSVYSRFISC